ncbi:hypothetical protein [Peristeroidobacter soli]|uniref:hypothetical protein n=1 Tax=Peristeroidobacter soli TaxID=2497877 RepID=UPI00101D6786|nr:hypothetical protein [Peristeroidobacter soli]
MNSYWNKLEQLREPTADNMTALGAWVHDEALPWLWSELAGVILEPKKKHPNATAQPAPAQLRPMQEKDAVRHGLFTSTVDRNNKRTEPAFYRAQLTMLDSEARRYCRSIDCFASERPVFAADASVHTVHLALLEMMGLAIVLLEDAAREVAQVPGYFAAFRRQHESPFEVFKGAEQIIYGTYSGMTHMDRAPYTAVAVLRTAVELRLRGAFGVSVLIDPTRPEDFVPIDMSSLFESIRKRQSDIDFSVDLHDVWKIYRWSNFYLHAGHRDYPWVAGFLLQYLRPLFSDHRTGPNGEWNIDGGIRMKRETWRAVRATLQSPSLNSTLAACHRPAYWSHLVIGI